MKKIFPFYKDQNIANNPLGYTNVNNARKRMKADEVMKDFEATLPEDYWLNHIYVYELENAWSSDWNDSIAADYKRDRYMRHHGVSTSVFLYQTTIYTKGYTKPNKSIPLMQLSPEIRNLYTRLYYLEKEVTKDRINKTETHKEEYVSLIKEILTKGYFPHLFKEYKDRDKRYRKFVDEHVEFREMDVNIEINTIDNSTNV